jgi:hypothetical protein
MGGFSHIFKTLNQNAEKLTNGEAFDDEALPDFGKNGGDESVGEHYEVPFENSANPTRWEKAVMGLHGMVKQVSKVDPDGLDIVCFGGSDDISKSKLSKSSKISVYRNVKNAKDVERMVTSKLPSGPCNMGKAMDYVLKEAFDKGFKKRPCGILVLTAGCPDDSERLERSLQQASERIASAKYKKKEPPISVTFVHVGDDHKAEEYMQHLANNMVSHKKSKKTGEVVDIVDTIKHRDIQAAMKEIKGTKSSGKTGAIIGAFAGAAMGVGGMYLYNKHQAKKRTEGWNGKWKATYEGCEIATLTVKDDMKGHLSIDGFDGGRTTGRYAENKNAYTITFRDADEHWRITGDIEDEHTIFWSDGTRWDEIPPKGGKWTHYAGAAVAGAATGGAIGYLLDKKFFKKCSKKDQCDYVIMVDRSAMMAIQDQTTMSGDDDSDDEYGIEEYKPNAKNQNQNNSYIQSATNKFNNLSTGEKVAVGVAGAAAVAGVTAAGVGIAHAVKSSGNKDKNAPVVTARAIDSGGDSGGGSRSANAYRGGFNGKWRSTYDGDTLAVLDVADDKNGTLTIDGFMGGNTIGKYVRNGSNQNIAKIHFIDADENWAVNGDVKGTKETVVIWEDGSRWDKIA